MMDTDMVESVYRDQPYLPELNGPWLPIDHPLFAPVLEDRLMRTRERVIGAMFSAMLRGEWPYD